MSKSSSYQTRHFTQDAQRRKEYWETGIGLNKVDNLQPSEYLIELARRHIDGEVTNDEIEPLLYAYYTRCPSDTYECDIVTKRIVDLLEQNRFVLSPQILESIHKYLFIDILDMKIAGNFRDYNIIKPESILGGATVSYGSSIMILDLLEYDFEREKTYHYSNLTVEKDLNHFSDFISQIWQIHPFGEGNTRTIAIFMTLYLKSLGYDVDYNVFKESSAYFRGALVRANYRNVKRQIDMDDRYLHRFMENLLRRKDHVLCIRDLIIGYLSRSCK